MLRERVAGDGNQLIVTPADERSAKKTGEEQMAASLHARFFAGILSGAAALAVAPAGAQELKEFNFMSPNHATCGPFAQVVGDEMGFFAEEGLKVNLLNSDTSIPFVAFLSNGDADLVTLDAGQVLQAATAKQPIKVLYEAYQFASDGLVVPAESELKGLADLKGKTVGLASDRDQLTTIIALQTVGLTGADIETAVVGQSGPVLAKALQDGTIDAFAGSISDRVGIEAAGVAIVNITPAEVSMNPANSFVAWGPTLEEKRPMIEGFLRAWAKSVHAGVVDTKAVMSACKKRIPEQWEKPGNGERIVNTSVFTTQIRRTVRYGELQPDVWENIQPPYVELGEIPEKIDVTVFLDDSFTDAANNFKTADVKKGIKAWKEANKDILIP
jgi:NitT/TauT family transport system substrate-binding protein